MIHQERAVRSAILFICFAAFFASNPLMFWSTSLFAQVSIDPPILTTYVNGFGATGLLLCIVTALRSLSTPPVRLTAWCTRIGAACYCIAGSAYGLLQSSLVQNTEVVGVISGMVMGIGLVVMILAWCYLLSCFDLKSALIGFSLACGAATLICWAFEVELLPWSFGAYIGCLLVGIAPPVYGSFKRTTETAFSNDGLVTEHLWGSMRSMILNPCLGLFLLLFTMSAREFVFRGFDDIGAISVIVASLISLALGIGWKRFSLSTIYNIWIPAVAALFLVLSSFPIETTSFVVAFLISHILMALIALLALASLCAVAKAGEFSPMMVGSAFAGIAILAIVLGRNLALRMPQDDTLGAVLLCCSTLYFVYMLASPLIDYYQRSKEDATDLGIVSSTFTHMEPDQESICKALAEKHNLSSREQEILPFLVRGHRPSYVADKLCISEHTVRTHVRNMYRKLGVNSQEELLQLAEKRAL